MGYVHARLSTTGDRQCRNFQTARLASMVPGPENELSRALIATRQIQEFGVLGLVPEFRTAMMRLSARISNALGPLNVPDVRANRSVNARDPLSPQLLNRLTRENGDDLALLDHIRRQHRAA
jgi:hypothetical protein